MKKLISTTGLCLMVLMIVAFGIRYFKVDTLPPGLTWDEAAIGYNGFAVVNTFRDEWLFRLPISFRSFGDYKAPLAIYVTGVFTKLFGLNVLAVRLPFVLAGTLSIGAIFWLAREWWLSFGNSISKSPKVDKLFFNSRARLSAAGLISALLLTFSPWHLHFSRAGFEVGMALLLLMVGISSWLKSVRADSSRWLLVSALMLSASLYTYHSAKVVVPLVIIGLIIGQLSYWQKRWRSLLMGGFALGVLLLPLAYDSLMGKGAERFSQTTVFSDSQPLFSSLAQVGSNFLTHLHPDFLVFGKVAEARMGMEGFGVLDPITYVLVVFFVIALISRLYVMVKNFAADRSIARVQLQLFARNTLLKERWLPIWLIGAGLLPAALGADIAPHTIRSLMALPGFILLAVSVIFELVDRIQLSRVNQTIKGSQGETNVVIKTFLGMLLLIYLMISVRFVSEYFSLFPALSSDDFAAKTLEAVAIAHDYEKGEGVSEKDKIIFTDAYGQPYIYSLSVRKTTPYEYHSGSLIKYEFKAVDPGDLLRPNALIVAGRDELLDVPLTRFEEVLYGRDGQVRFKIFVTD